MIMFGSFYGSGIERVQVIFNLEGQDSIRIILMITLIVQQIIYLYLTQYY